MNFEEFKILCNKERRYNRRVLIFSAPLFVAWIGIMIGLVLEVQFVAWILLAIFIVCTIIGTITFIFGWKADECREKTEKYVISVIENVLKSNGATQDDFQILCSRENEYIVIFSNSNIDCNVVKKQVIFAIKELRKASGKNILVHIETKTIEE